MGQRRQAAAGRRGRGLRPFPRRWGEGIVRFPATRASFSTQYVDLSSTYYVCFDTFGRLETGPTRPPGCARGRRRSDGIPAQRSDTRNRFPQEGGCEDPGRPVPA